MRKQYILPFLGILFLIFYCTEAAVTKKLTDIIPEPIFDSSEINVEESILPDTLIDTSVQQKSTLEQETFYEEYYLNFKSISKTHFVVEKFTYDYYDLKLTNYSIDLKLKPASGGKIKRDGFIFQGTRVKTTLLDERLQTIFAFGKLPCVPDCDTILYAHTKQGVFRLSNLKIIEEKNVMCGEPVKCISVAHDSVPAQPYFTSSFQGSEENTFVSPKKLLAQKIPDWINLDSLAIPTNGKSTKINCYKYSEEDSLYIAEVRVEGKMELDKYSGATETTWTGLYFISPNNYKILTPIEGYEQVYFETDFTFFGLEDINGDGTLDILVGKKMGMILERYDTGFRTWCFAFSPPYGC